MTPGSPTLQVTPSGVIPGGVVWVHGPELGLPEAMGEIASVGGVPARVLFATPGRVALECPPEAADTTALVTLGWMPGRHGAVRVGELWATGLHQVDSPTFDADGALYVTYSGSRGQQAPVSVYRITPGGTREIFVTGLVNATSARFGRDGQLYVSSRFDGTLSRVSPSGAYDTVASDLGRACGLACGSGAEMYVGDRSGTIFAVDVESGTVRTVATLPPSVAAFHLASARDGTLYVTGPTLAPYDRIYTISPEGQVSTLPQLFGRPQGLALDDQDRLHVTEALAGASGVFRLEPDGGRTLMVAGQALIGCAFSSGGVFAVCSSDSAYRFRPGDSGTAFG